jgi:predicted metalloprotease
LLIGLFFGVDPGVLTNVVQETQRSAPAQRPAQLPAEAGSGSTLAQECQVGADANERQDCRIVGIVNSIQQYWINVASRQGGQYQPARTRLFTGVTSTGCGFASAAVGDDRIQAKAQGRVTPESWTHGSGEQRQRWFLAGYQHGQTDVCDTFSGEI